MDLSEHPRIGRDDGAPDWKWMRQESSPAILCVYWNQMNMLNISEICQKSLVYGWLMGTFPVLIKIVDTHLIYCVAASIFMACRAKYSQPPVPQAHHEWAATSAWVECQGDPGTDRYDFMLPENAAEEITNRELWIAFGGVYEFMLIFLTKTLIMVSAALCFTIKVWRMRRKL